MKQQNFSGGYEGAERCRLFFLPDWAWEPEEGSIRCLRCTWYQKGSLTVGEYKALLTLLNPVAPHMTEEIWRNLGETTDLAYAAWPQWDEKALVKSEVEIAVQVCGKIRGRIMIPADMTKEAAETELVNHPEVQKILAGKTVMKVIFVPGRLVNFIAK